MRVRRYAIVDTTGAVRWQVSLADPSLYPRAILANMQPGDIACEVEVRTDIDAAELPSAAPLALDRHADQVRGTRDFAIRNWHNRTHHSRAQRRDTPARGPEIVGIYAFGGDVASDLPTRRSMVPIPDELVGAPRLLFWRDGATVRRRIGDRWSIDPEELLP